jgi:DNA-binding transcriptional MerR regulator
MRSSPGGIQPDPKHEETDRRLYTPSSTRDILQFGLDAKDISNYSVKRYIDPPAIQDPETEEFLQTYLRERAREIHPPLTTMARLQQYLREAWSPITPFLGLPELYGRRFMTCVASRAQDNQAKRERALAAARAKADTFNRLHSTMGHMTAYISTDAVTVCAYVFVDRADAIAESVKHALHFAAVDRLRFAGARGVRVGGEASLTDDPSGGLVAEE